MSDAGSSAVVAVAASVAAAASPNGALVWAAFLAAPTSGFCSVLNAALSAELAAVVSDTVWGGVWGSVLLNIVSVVINAILGIPGGPGWKTTKASFKENWELEWYSVFTSTMSGVFDGFYNTAAVLIPPKIGYSLFFVSVVCLEVFASLTLEFTGLFWTEKKPLQHQTLIGAGIVLTGAIIFQVESLTAGPVGDNFSISTVGYILISAVAGFVLPVQGALQRRMMRVLKNPFRTMSLTQTFSILFCVFVALASQSTPNLGNIETNDIPLFLGGVCTAWTMFCLVTLPTYIGFPAMVGWLIFGQLFLSFILDAVGAFNREVIPTTALRVVGLVTVLIGVTLVQLSQTAKYNRILQDSFHWMVNLFRRCCCCSTTPAAKDANATELSFLKTPLAVASPQSPNAGDSSAHSILLGAKKFSKGSSSSSDDSSDSPSSVSASIVVAAVPENSRRRNSAAEKDLER